MARKLRDPAWKPVDYKDADVGALQALQRGDATEQQQKRALRWLVEKAAGTYEVSYRSDVDGGDRETAFAEGRRFVGLQTVKLLNMTRNERDALLEKEQHGRRTSE